MKNQVILYFKLKMIILNGQISPVINELIKDNHLIEAGRTPRRGSNAPRKKSEEKKNYSPNLRF